MNRSFVTALTRLAFACSADHATAGDFTGLRVDDLLGFAVALPIPEPATASLGLLALGSLMLRRRRMA